MSKKSFLQPSLLALAGAIMALGLAGCDDKKDAPAPAATASALPLTTGPAMPVVAAPAAAALPSAPRVRVGRVTNPSDRYAYVDRAYEMSDAIGQAPPDYGFDYEGVHPWVWRSSNRDVRLVEPVADGYRYYYYRPGAAEPYLVRDPRYSYGFSDGQLIAVYDEEGRLLRPDDVDRRADDAGRYLARATALYQASLRSERRRVNAANWAARRAALDGERSRWEAQQRQQDDWRSYHDQHEAEGQAYWRGERDERQRSAQSFEEWQKRGYDGPPPPVANAGRDGQVRQESGSRDHGRFDRPGDGPQRDQADAARADAARQADAVARAQAEATQQKARADAAQQADAVARAQRAQTDAAQQKARADAAQQADAVARAQRAQADAAQQKARADAAQQADVVARAQRAQADAAQQKARADAAQQAKAATDAAAQAQRVKAEADLQKARADAAQQAKAATDAAAQAQRVKADADLQKARADVAQQKPAGPQAQTTPAQPTDLTNKELLAARRAAAKKARDDARRRDDGAEKPQ